MLCFLATPCSCCCGFICGCHWHAGRESIVIFVPWMGVHHQQGVIVGKQGRGDPSPAFHVPDMVIQRNNKRLIVQSWTAAWHRGEYCEHHVFRDCVRGGDETAKCIRKVQRVVWWERLSACGSPYTKNGYDSRSSHGTSFRRGY